jgi:hypothetical protein
MNILDSDPKRDKFLNVGGAGDTTTQGAYPTSIIDFLLDCSILPIG